jgi:RNA recognition motif-containing protein
MSIYIGNLSYDVTEEDLRQVFAEYGPVKRVSVPTDRETNRSRGFGFVEMEKMEDEDKAIELLDGSRMDGTAIASEQSQTQRR